MKLSKLRLWSFVLASILSPVLLVVVAAMILGYYGFTMDVLSALVAAGTVELALLAGLQDRIRGWLMSPELDISIRLELPCCHQVPVRFEEIGGAVTITHRYPVYYYRLEVCNNGEASAQKVEVSLVKVYEYKDGKPQRLGSFPIDNLNWSTMGTKSKVFYVEGGVLKVSETLEPAVYCDYISPRTYKYCTLGHIWNPDHRNKDPYGTPPFPVKEGRSTFCFDVSFKSNSNYYHLPEGTYGIEIQVAASNAETRTKRFKIEVTGNWSDDEGSMLREGFKIKEVKYDFDKYAEKVVSKEGVPGKSEAGTADKEKLATETTAESQPLASGAAPQTTATDEDKKEKEEASKS